MMNNLKKLYKDFFGLTEQTVSTDMVDEAQLVNNLTDYKGGIEYVIRDPQLAQSVSDEIRQWVEKKGFTIIKQAISKTGRVGYMYFRLGEDVALDSQKLQGYLAQKPELKHFRFKVRIEQQPDQQTTPTTISTPTRNPQGNI